MESNEIKSEYYFEFLEALRESGTTNMFGAVPYLTTVFDELDNEKATKVLIDWMNSYEKK